ncbi:hypothetical protein [Catenulispora sp. GP43]|uniref:hypothetical protein n=1 Tax=Catenulispora sp. GP43 TaxID=3156263 RepID=UPI0035118618
MATRLSATAAAIGLVGGVFAASSAGAVDAAARPGSAPAAGLAVGLSAGLPAGAAVPAALAEPGAGSIPFSVADPDTAPRPVVTVAIGGVPLLLLLDTGSTGIRVAGDKIPAGAVAVTGAAAAYGYGSGIQLHGDRADADVAIGDFHTGPLPIELVRSTDCFADKPDCPAAHGVKPAMFGGVLDGIMGVSPEEISGLMNPLWALHNAAGEHIGRQFAVRYDPELVSGEVQLNVPAAGYGLAQLPRTPGSGNGHPGTQRGYDARAYVSSYMGSYASRSNTGAVADHPATAAFAAPPSWNPRAVQTCVEGAGLRKSCGPAMFDTGTPEFALNVPGGPAGTWPAGRSLVVGVPAGGWTADYSTGPGAGVTVADAPSTANSGTLIGLPAFAKGPIRFDLEAGTVGFPVASSRPQQQQRALVPAATTITSATPRPDPRHTAPKKLHPRLPFLKPSKEARSLPDTGVPMSAALGAVTALTALFVGIGTVLAARRRPDHES